MKFNQKHKNQEFLLALFEKKFTPVIEQTRNFLIRYQPQEKIFKKTYFDELFPLSVNGCNSPDEFRKMLISMMDSSLYAVYESLEGTGNTHCKPLLDHIRMKVAGFNDVIVEESMLVNDAFGEDAIHQHFRCFRNCRFKGFKEISSMEFNHSIHLTIEKFALVWLEVISYALDQLELIGDYLLNDQSEKSLSTSPVTLKTNYFKIKFNLTVAEIGTLFRLCKKISLFEVPWRQNPQLLQWLIENIESKKCDNIHWQSMHKNFYTSDASALSTLKTICQQIIILVDEEYEQISK